MKLVWLLNAWITSVTIHSQGSSFLSVLWSWTWLWQSLGLVLLHYRGVNWVPEIFDDFSTLYNEVLLGLEPESRPLPCKPWGHSTTFWFPCPMIYLSGGGTWEVDTGRYPSFISAFCIHQRERLSASVKLVGKRWANKDGLGKLEEKRGGERWKVMILGE